LLSSNLSVILPLWGNCGGYRSIKKDWKLRSYRSMGGKGGKGGTAKKLEEFFIP